MLTTSEIIKNLLDNGAMAGLFIVGSVYLIKAVNEFPFKPKKKNKNITVTSSDPKNKVA